MQKYRVTKNVLEVYEPEAEGWYTLATLHEPSGGDVDELLARANAADFLFQLLDDIDTTDDMAKKNDKAYRKRVQHLQKRRFKVANSDGYSVTFFNAAKS